MVIRKKPVVSIIVPVFNMEKYLTRCLDSILNQTLTSIEIICVNDGSTDDSGIILNRYAQMDSRIIVIEQENSGPNIARKRGIELASGQYIGFVDSDDWIDVTMYEKLLYKAEKDSCDLVICDYYISKIPNLIYEKGYTGKKLNPQEFMDVSAPPYLCIKLFSSILKEYMLCSVGKSQAEDVGLLYPVLPHVKKMGYVAEPLYYYYQRSDSSSNDDSFVTNYHIEEYLSTLHQLIAKDYGKYQPWAVKHFVQMIYWGLNNSKRKPFLANYIEFLQNNSSYLIGCSTLKQFKDISQYLCCETIPRRLVCTEQDSKSAYFNYCQKSWQNYARDCDIVIINIDMYKNLPGIVELAIKLGEEKFVDDYIKLRNIYENGGIAISGRVQFNKPLGELRAQPAFFGYAEGKKVNSDIWGATKNHMLLEQVLSSYEKDSLMNTIEVDLGQRFYYLLCADYNLPQGDLNEHNLKDNVKIFRCDKLTYNVNSNNVATLYDDVVSLAEKNGNVVAPKNVIEMLILEARKDERRRSGKSNVNDRNFYQNEYYRIKNSRSWKITRPLRKVVNFFRKVKYPDSEIE